MNRTNIQPRQDWKKKVGDLGLVWHSFDNTQYWNEGAYYSFKRKEVSALYNATEKLYHMFLAAGDHIVKNNLFSKFCIPDYIVPYLIKKWEEAPPALNYGRFDLGYDGTNIKLFEFNCDTPTSLLEAAVVQWSWKEEVFPEDDQYNSIHEVLLQKWRDIAAHAQSETLHVMHSEADAVGEDTITTAYMADLAEEAGFGAVVPIVAGDIGWDGKELIDLTNKPIKTLYKLYPWEWLVKEEFGKHIPNTFTDWIEPVWKMMFSNKAILPVLWELYPDHPLLLEASFKELKGNHVSKPILGREGSNIAIVKASEGVWSQVQCTDGIYQDNPIVYQELFNLPCFDGKYPVIGSWIVDGEPCGVGVREGGLITNNTSMFVPHIMED